MGAQRNQTIAAAESMTRSAPDESLGVPRRPPLSRGQAWRGEKALVAVALVALLALTGCGKKPRNVDPPEGTAEIFPRVYPQDPDAPPQKAPDPSSVLRSKI
ncbi:MAG: hypothetical protein JWM77_1037 [Rhodospirillales bacterium]|nr:hypothetical protein [Rhodospirillales bacterium]